MSRPLRLEFPDAVYHVTSRGDRREPIYRDDADRIDCLAVIAQAMERFDAQVLAYGLRGQVLPFVVVDGPAPRGASMLIYLFCAFALGIALGWILLWQWVLLKAYGNAQGNGANGPGSGVLLWRLLAAVASVSLASMTAIELSTWGPLDAPGASLWAAGIATAIWLGWRRANRSIQKRLMSVGKR